MPSTSDRTRTTPLEPTEMSAAFVRASVDAGHTWARLYLDSVERAVDYQIKVVEQITSANEHYLSAATSAADRVGTEVAEVARKPAERPAKAQARTASKSAQPAKKTQGQAAKSAQPAKKTQGQAAKSAQPAKKTQTAKNTQAQTATGAADKPLARYDELNADQVVAKLPGASQQTLSQVGAYERKHQARSTVLDRVEALTATEPVRGFGELTVAEIEQLLRDGDEQFAKRVRDYERSHAGRTGVLQAAELQLKQG